MLRTIEQECNKEKLQSVAIQLPIEVATLLLNEKRNDIKDIETKSECTIVVIPNRYFEIPKFHIERSAQNSGKASYKVVEQPLEEDLDKNNKTETKQEKLEPAVKQVVPNQAGKKNKSIFGFIKDLITPSNDEVSDESSEGGASSDKAIDEERKRSRPENRQRNNRNRRSNRNRKSNYKDKFPKDNAVNNSAISPDKNPSEKSLKETASIELKVEEKPVLAKKPVPTKPKRKKTEELPKVDLNSVGLKLVETSSKPISEPKKENTKKAPPKKVADWQKQKTDKKDTKELVMVETKTTKVAKPKKTTKPKAAPKTKKAKVTSKKD
jgi:ribonuclease E